MKMSYSLLTVIKKKKTLEIQELIFKIFLGCICLVLLFLRKPFEVFSLFSSTIFKNWEGIGKNS